MGNNKKQMKLLITAINIDCEKATRTETDKPLG
jgi:hypothetical protein